MSTQVRKCGKFTNESFVCPTQTEFITSKMDSTSNFSAANSTNLTTTQPPPIEGLYDPLWAIILRWIIGGIIVTVGKYINEYHFIPFCRQLIISRY